MIVRSAKHILRGILFETSLPFLAPTIAHFFNCLLSRQNDNSNTAKKKKKKKGKKLEGGHTPSTLWTAIVKMTNQRYNYSLPAERTQLNEVRERVSDRNSPEISPSFR